MIMLTLLIKAGEIEEKKIVIISRFCLFVLEVFPYLLVKSSLGT
jgi:hypothetical protein